ncbi:GNAT family N-acetyltransferase [Shimia marina]|uniref:Putative N-acetyltransferase YjaB n=1 Tax=Shimia marina TaxID=321267 RepID=A0A0P1EVC6_9RHOB|nr:GNAT family N-acetyltransferase [Shimia marina]CUH54402.1 putative N-acetyltransferase YjaB [Shimia marina]SFE02790.1 Acetyltransferase (GNAT) domain-containing protein [Shimia marina]
MNKGDIRRAQVADAPAMARIVSDWEAATDWMPSIYGPEEIADMIREAMPEREMWVAGNPIEGYLSFDPKVNRVGGLYCRKTGAGLGKALMEKAKEGRDFIWLHTHEANEAAQRFYKREGFEEVSRHDGDIHKGLREVRMEWRR